MPPIENQRIVPTKIAGPSGHIVINDQPVGWEAAEYIRQRVVAEAPARAAAAAEQAEQRRLEYIKLREAAAVEQAKQLEAFLVEVADAVKAAGALKRTPPAPLLFREGARAILHGGKGGFIPPPVPGNHDPMLVELLSLKERGQSYTHGGLDALTPAGLAELDAAEIAIHNTLLAVARVVSGE